jgi:uncharacterized protein (TIGR02271 family)
MNKVKTVRVTDKEGQRGTIESANIPNERETQVLVQLDNGQRVLIPSGTLVLQDDGSYYLPFSLAEIQDQAHREPGEEVLVVPVMVEELEVQKRQIETGGVRITKVVHEREELVDELLLKEELEVERVPINRPVDGPIPIRYVGNTMIVSLLEEVLVVEKRLMLKEELHINTRQVETRQPQSVILRSEEATIEPIDNPNKEVTG